MTFTRVKLPLCTREEFEEIRNRRYPSPLNLDPESFNPELRIKQIVARVEENRAGDFTSDLMLQYTNWATGHIFYRQPLQGERETLITFYDLESRHTLTSRTTDETVLQLEDILTKASKSSSWLTLLFLSKPQLTHLWTIIF